MIGHDPLVVYAETIKEPAVRKRPVLSNIFGLLVVLSALWAAGASPFYMPAIAGH